MINFSIDPIYFFIKNKSHKYDTLLLYLFIILTFYTFVFSHALYHTLIKIFYTVITFLLLKKKIQVSDVIDYTSFFIVVFFSIAILSNIYNQLPIDITFRILTWLFPYLLAKIAIQYGKISPKRIAYFLCISVLLLAMVAVIAKVFALDTIFGKEIFNYGRFSFTMGGSNRAAFYLSTSILILLGLAVSQKKYNLPKDTILFYLPMGVMFFALILTAEKKSIYLLPFFAILFVLLSKKIKILFLLVVMTLTVIFSIGIPKRLSISNISRQSSTVYARLNAWEISCHLINQNLVIGHGYGSFKDSSISYFKKNSTKFSFKKYKPLYCAHNINLNTLVETGIFGLIILNAIFLTSLWLIFRNESPKNFAFYIGLTLVFIYMETLVGSFIRSEHRTNLTFLLMGIYAGISSQAQLSSHRKFNIFFQSSPPKNQT